MIKENNKRVAVTLPENVLNMADIVCEKSGISKSQFFYNLIIDYMKENEIEMYKEDLKKIFELYKEELRN